MPYYDILPEERNRIIECGNVKQVDKDFIVEKLKE